MPAHRSGGRSSAFGSNTETASDERHSTGNRLSQNCTSIMSGLTPMSVHGTLTGRLRTWAAIAHPLQAAGGIDARRALIRGGQPGGGPVRSGRDARGARTVGVNVLRLNQRTEVLIS